MNVPDEIVDLEKLTEAVQLLSSLKKIIISVTRYAGPDMCISVYPWGMTKIAPASEWQLVETEPCWDDGEPKGYKYDAFITVNGVRFRAFLDESQVPEGAVRSEPPILVGATAAVMAEAVPA